MAEETKTKKRKWYNGIWRKTGIVIAGIGGLCMLVPGAPVVASIAGIEITTTMIGYAATFLGTNVFSFGTGKNVERDVENEK